MDIVELLKMMVEKDASDIHLKVDSPPILRIKRELITTEFPPLSRKDTEKMAYFLMKDRHRRQFEEGNEVDFAYNLLGVGRFRANIFRQRGKIGIVMRLIRIGIPSFEELGLPPILKKISLSERGLILATGTSSCGKTTTMSAMIDYINSNRKCHIMTIEDPIEYLHQDKIATINQREVGLDTDSFSLALRHVTRQDPDVIVIGEMRDAESFQAAKSASETGHLVLSTLHAADVTQVISRILGFFPTAQHDQVRVHLANNIRAIICQRLIQKASGEGVVPAVEILVSTPTVVSLIREDKIVKLHSAMQRGTAEGMQTFNQSLVKLLKDKVIILEEALAKSSNPEALKMNIKGIYLDEDRAILG